MRKLFLNLIDVTEDMQMVLEQVSENTNLRIWMCSNARLDLHRRKKLRHFEYFRMDPLTHF